MKKCQLLDIIKEEVYNIMKEQDVAPTSGTTNPQNGSLSAITTKLSSVLTPQVIKSNINNVQKAISLFDFILNLLPATVVNNTFAATINKNILQKVKTNATATTNPPAPNTPPAAGTQPASPNAQKQPSGGAPQSGVTESFRKKVVKRK